MQQKLKSDLTKDLILEESFKLFYENGFKSTSVDKIMVATKLTKGAFYHHYKNKKQIGLEVIGSKIRQRVVDNMVAPLEKPGNAVEILESTFTEKLSAFSFYDKQHGCAMNNFINEVADFETAYQIALKNIFEEWKAAIVNLIKRGQHEGLILPSISSEAVAIFLISSFEGIRGMRKLYNDDVILDEYIAGLSLYINQLKA